MLHVGTLISVLAAYWRDIFALIYELIMVFKDIFTGKGLRINANPTRKFGFLIIVASIPTGIMGVLLNDFFSAMYLSFAVIGAGFIVTGIILLVAEKMGKNKKSISDMPFRSAFFIGICQGVAICPGISRSGATLFGGLVSGLNRKAAVKFAFIISIPSILGSAAIEAPKAFKGGVDMALAAPMALGVLIAAVCGFIAIKTMIRIVSNKKLYYFSIYTWVLGVVVLIYAFLS